MRYFIEIAYNGTQYCGWQKQPNAITVQEVLEDCLSKILRQTIVSMGAGRTDAGVHARQLYVHFDVKERIEDANFLFKINSFLPEDIAVNSIAEVAHDAHARFDAVKRSYEYKVAIGKNPFTIMQSHQIYKMPDVAIMNKAASILYDYKDFQCFSRSNTDVKTYHCNIMQAKWEQKDNLLIFYISADRFLRNMVRAIVGTLLDVGFGKTTLEELKTIIESKDRAKAGASAPARGLYLTEVAYPEAILTQQL